MPLVYGEMSKINEVDLPVCSICGIPAVKTIEHYSQFDNCWFRKKNDFTARKLCPECIIGKKIPMFCNYRKKWDNPTVVSYDEETCLHEIAFSCGRFETLSVNSRPFQEYFSSFREPRLENRNREKWPYANHHIITPPRRDEYTRFQESDSIILFDPKLSSGRSTPYVSALIQTKHGSRFDLSNDCYILRFHSRIALKKVLFQLRAILMIYRSSPYLIQVSHLPKDTMLSNGTEMSCTTLNLTNFSHQEK